MKPSKSIKERKECECVESQYAPGEWVYTDCPFGVKDQKTARKETNAIDFYKILSCSCGKEIGEIQFSGYEAGKWRIFEDKLIAEEKLNRFKDYMHFGFFKDLQPLLEKMAKIEKSIIFTSKMYEKIV
jgi:hypothetical protein